VSVDTYLQRKRLDRYRKFHRGEFEILLAPVLNRSARAVHFELKRRLFGRTLAVEIVPIKDHFHSPT
jgi:hypothetical protein